MDLGRSIHEPEEGRIRDDNVKYNPVLQQVDNEDLIEDFPYTKEQGIGGTEIDLIISLLLFFGLCIGFAIVFGVIRV